MVCSRTPPERFGYPNHIVATICMTDPQNQHTEHLLLCSLMDETSKTGLSAVSIREAKVSLPLAWTTLPSSDVSFRMSEDLISREVICQPYTMMTGLSWIDQAFLPPMAISPVSVPSTVSLLGLTRNESAVR